MIQLGPRGRAAALSLAVLALVVAGAATVGVSTVTGGNDPAPRVPGELVEPRPGDNVFWPYTSRSRTPDGRTLAINVVVHGDADALRFYLSERRDATWNETTADEEDVDPDDPTAFSEEGDNATAVHWANARGARRFLYVHNHAFTQEGENDTVRRPHRALPYIREGPAEVGGEWIDESYQLHDGTYFGTRYHLRVYESPYESDDWTAIQAHSDHWDWFRLRHTVDGTERAQNRVESEFMGRRFVDAVWRMYLHNDEGSDSDGWATVIDLYGASSSPVADDEDGEGDPDEARNGAAGPDPVPTRGDETARVETDGNETTPTPAVLETQAPTAGTPPTTPGTSGPETLSAGLFAVLGAVLWLPRRLRGGRSGATDDTGHSQHPEGERDRTALPRIGPLERLDNRQLVVLFRWTTYGLLFASLFALYLSVRAAGILLESQFPTVSPKVIAASLYPFIAFGLPICAYYFARTVDETRGFVLAAAGMEAAIVADYLWLNITVLALDVVLHRLGVAIALGLIAAGAVRPGSTVQRVNRWFAAGVLLWAYLLIAPLVGWL